MPWRSSPTGYEVDVGGAGASSDHPARQPVSAAGGRQKRNFTDGQAARQRRTWCSRKDLPARQRCRALPTWVRGAEERLSTSRGAADRDARHSAPGGEQCRRAAARPDQGRRSRAAPGRPQGGVDDGAGALAASDINNITERHDSQRPRSPHAGRAEQGGQVLPPDADVPRHGSKLRGASAGAGRCVTPSRASWCRRAGHA